MSGPQGGAVALLMALMLLVLLSVGALATARNVEREWESTGSDLRGAQAFLAAESGLAWAAAGHPGLPAEGGPPWTLPPEGERLLDDGPGCRTAFRVTGRCLGWSARPGDPDRLEAIWEWTAHGFATVGPSGPAAQRYEQTCRAWWAYPAAGAGGSPRPLAWQHLK